MYQESEISWIGQGDISPILRAYSQLEILQIRGGDRLQFNAPVRHDNLQALIVETGGSDAYGGLRLRDKPKIPSPPSISPRPVSQALRTTKSALRSIL